MASPSREDYLEAIWILTRDRGAARVSDIAARLHLSVASASKMVRRLDQDGLLKYERYRGLTLTALGEGRGRSLAARHEMLERFLQQLGLRDPARIHDIVEGIEHFIDGEALSAIEALLDLADRDPAWWERFVAHQRQRAGTRPASPPMQTDP